MRAKLISIDPGWSGAMAVFENGLLKTTKLKDQFCFCLRKKISSLLKKKKKRLFYY